MAIIGIVAIDRNYAIGRGGTVPWHYSSDLKFFKQQTLGNACVMGYRTWASLKKPLRDRLNIVLSRTRDIEPQPSVVVLRSRESVLALKDYLKCDLYVIGGEKVYRAFTGDIDRWIVTEVPIVAEDADTFMPRDFLNGFTATGSVPLEDGPRVVIYDKEGRLDAGC